DDQQAVLERFPGAYPGQGWLRADCPLCPDRGKDGEGVGTLGLNTDTGGYNCFRCGATGWVPGFAADADLPGERQDPDAPPGVPPPEGFIELGVEPGRSASATLEARAYLAARGVSLDAIRGAGIGVCLRGRCRGRIVVPHEPGPRSWGG